MWDLDKVSHLWTNKTMSHTPLSNFKPFHDPSSLSSSLAFNSCLRHSSDLFQRKMNLFERSSCISPGTTSPAWSQERSEVELKGVMGRNCCVSSQVCILQRSIWRPIRPQRRVKAVPVWSSSRCCFLLPVFGGCTATILRGLTYPKTLYAAEK